MSLCRGRRAARRAFAVVGCDSVAVHYTGQECEVVVAALRADVHDFTIAAELVAGDDTVGVLWWPPADLH